MARATEVKVKTVTRGALLAAFSIALAVASAAPARAQDQPADGAAKAPSSADANNPLAKFEAFNVHNY